MRNAKTDHIIFLKAPPRLPKKIWRHGGGSRLVVSARLANFEDEQRQQRERGVGCLEIQRLGQLCAVRDFYL